MIARIFKATGDIETHPVSGNFEFAKDALKVTLEMDRGVFRVQLMDEEFDRVCWDSYLLAPAPKTGALAFAGTPFDSYRLEVLAECPDCYGSGVDADELCPTCKGRASWDHYADYTGPKAARTVARAEAYASVFYRDTRIITLEKAS